MYYCLYCFVVLWLEYIQEVVKKCINIDIFREIQQLFSSLVDSKGKILPSNFLRISLSELECIIFSK